jgi:hypothetical protein
MFVALALGTGPALLGAAEESAEGATPAPTSAETIVQDLTRQIPQSVFIDRQEPGIRDPFFPGSTRVWKGGKPDQPPEPLSMDEKIDELVFLRGITGQEGDKVALLNNQTFKVGDTVKLKLRDGSPLKVTMVKILETSVAFTVEGQTKTWTKQLED